MSDAQKGLEVFETRRFKRVLDRLSEETQTVLEDAIDEIVANPLIGEQKKGDFKYLRVYKVKSGPTEYLVGYNFNEGRLVIHLLQLGPHENYYRDAQNRKKSDLRLIG